MACLSLVLIVYHAMYFLLYLDAQIGHGRETLDSSFAVAQAHLGYISIPTFFSRHGQTPYTTIVFHADESKIYRFNSLQTL